ncbi:MAG TPA: pyruvate kinase [Victivallales bacterium]|nr:pyruvate kinase [Victivallales bacterium]
MKKARIIATLGPASNKLSIIESMAKAGMNVCRLNFSFGTKEEHLEMIAKIRQASKNIGKSLAIMQCLQGPKIRIGKLKNPVTVKKGQEIILSGNRNHDCEFTFPTTYSQIASDTEPGKKILIADGRVILKVIESYPDKKEVKCKVIEGGTILTGKGINLPYTKISLPTLTEKDIEDAKFGAKAKVDYISFSFVRKGSDIVQLRKLLDNNGGKQIPIIAKIEKPEAVENIDEIIKESNGIMIARGDLADELSFAKVPIVQKEIIKKANKKGKITIIATEMLSSMVDNQLPTRAEVSDVANGIFDGSDVVMLSNETAMGEFPVLAVKTMSDIVIEAENAFIDEPFYNDLELPDVHKLNEALCSAAAHLSYDLNNDAIAIFTRSGLTAQILSKYRPDCTIFAATNRKRTYYKLAFSHGIFPILLEDKIFKNEKANAKAIPVLINQLTERRLINKSRNLIVIAGDFSEGRWKINTIKVMKLQYS